MQPTRWFVLILMCFSLFGIACGGPEAGVEETDTPEEVTEEDLEEAEELREEAAEEVEDAEEATEEAE